MTAINASGTLSFRDLGTGTIQYKINEGGWNNLTGIDWPLNINNQDADNTTLQVLFTTDITLSESEEQYFECVSKNIQFGSKSLNANGSVPTITINGIANYPGLIKNGPTAYNSISILNLFVNATNGASLASDGGWIAQQGFANSVIENYIVNCSSNGVISDGGGGIVGASSGNGGELLITGCTSSGDIGPSGGGIGGRLCANGSSSDINVKQCSSTGLIGPNAGGICGNSCGINGGSITVSFCYSTGNIGVNAGGIYGINAGSARAINCYSKGSIGDGGGIYGANAGVTLARNCYSTGDIASGGGIYGSGFGGTATAQNCYTSGGALRLGGGGIWADSGSDTLPGQGADNYGESNNGGITWTTANANTVLQYAPSSGPVGASWVNMGTNTPYRLARMGFSPYNLQNITDDLTFTTSYSQTIAQGTNTIAAKLPAGYTYTIKAINSTDPSTYSTITINAATGQISVAADTIADVYSLVIQSEINPYAMTTFQLTVTDTPIPVPNGGTLVVTPCCNNPLLIRPSPATNNSSEVITANASGRTIIRNVNTYYDAIANRSTTYLAKPIFTTYREYMEYLQSNN